MTTAPQQKRPTPSAEMLQMGEAIRTVREARGMTQQDAADAMGITRQAFQNYEAGYRQAVLRSDLQDQIAEALGSTRAELLRLADQRVRLRASGGISTRSFAQGEAGELLPIRDRVKAGAWLETDDTSQVEPRTANIVADRRFPYADQWLSEVDGDSVNKLGILHGDLAHMVDIVAIRYQPIGGEVVEVERTRFGGTLRELTLKELEVLPDGSMKLWPRSTNPAHQDPLELTDGIGEGEDMEVRIRGLLLNSVRSFYPR